MSESKQNNKNKCHSRLDLESRKENKQRTDLNLFVFLLVSGSRIEYGMTNLFPSVFLFGSTIEAGPVLDMGLGMTILLRNFVCGYRN